MHENFISNFFVMPFAKFETIINNLLYRIYPKISACAYFDFIFIPSRSQKNLLITKIAAK
jgi:hypothetical protein